MEEGTFNARRSRLPPGKCCFGLRHEHFPRNSRFDNFHARKELKKSISFNSLFYWAVNREWEKGRRKGVEVASEM